MIFQAAFMLAMRNKTSSGVVPGDSFLHNR